jgi:hypothetical protein
VVIVYSSSRTSWDKVRIYLNITYYDLLILAKMYFVTVYLHTKLLIFVKWFGG